MSLAQFDYVYPNSYGPITANIDSLDPSLSNANDNSTVMVDFVNKLVHVFLNFTVGVGATTLDGILWQYKGTRQGGVDSLPSISSSVDTLTSRFTFNPTSGTPVSADIIFYDVGGNIDIALSISTSGFTVDNNTVNGVLIYPFD